MFCVFTLEGVEAAVQAAVPGIKKTKQKNLE